MTISVDQLTDAIIAVPGVCIIVQDTPPQRSGDVSISGAYTQFWPDGAGTITFNALVSGVYKMDFSAQAAGISAVAPSQIKVVIDEGTGSQQDIGDNEKFQYRAANGVYGNFTMTDLATLSAGDHTIKAYAETASGTIRFPGSGTAAYPPVAHFTLISGSGAGGSLTDSSVLGGDVSIDAAWKDTGLTATITTAKNEEVVLLFVGYANQSGGAGIEHVRFDIDGTPLASVDKTVPNGDSNSWCMARSSGELTAGSHTIKVQCGYTTNTWDLITGARLDVLRYRGGVVQQENYPIISNVSGDTFTYGPSKGSGGLALVLNDGKQYQGAASYSMDYTGGAGFLGLEASASLPPTVTSGIGNLSFAAAVGSSQQITDTTASGFLASMVGHKINIRGADDEENNGWFPILTYIDADNITIENSAGVLDAGGSASVTWSTGYAWIYNYAVPSLGNQFSIVGSNSPPSVGSLDYAVHKYLGYLFYRGSADKLRAVVQHGNEFTYNDITELNISPYEGYGQDITTIAGSWHSLVGNNAPGGYGDQRTIELAVSIVETESVYVSCSVGADAGDIFLLYVSHVGGWTPGTWTTDINSPRSAAQSVGVAIEDTAHTRSWHPMNEDLLFRWLIGSGTGTDWSIIVLGYKDAYLNFKRS